MSSLRPQAPNISFSKEQNAFVTDPNITVPGLYYFPNFISDEQQKLLVEHVDSQPFENHIYRRQQFYGERYYHTTYDMKEIQPGNTDGTNDCLDMSPFDWLVRKIKTFEKEQNVYIFGDDPDKQPSQVLMNEYVGNMGILNHFDDENAFGEVIVIISLLNPIWMNMTLPRVKKNSCQDLIYSQRILIEPKSLLVMRDDSRFLWRHGISKTKNIFLPDGQVRYRDQNYRRISLTIRKLLDGRKRVVQSEE